MTDRSNYGPVRRLSPSAIDIRIDIRKPYSRTGLKGVLGTLDLNSGDTAMPTPSDSPYYPFHAESPQLEAPTQSRTTGVPDGPRDIAGFPTYEQYQRIEGEYLSSLSDRKQPKALISQALFDKIFAVLQNGSEDRGSTAQFRFWVRKMFVLVYPQTSFNHNAGQTPEPVVLHDKRPVAIKERLYEVLCYCHAVARHGGRDKTCATLRLNYSWVPKELTAKFVKACPTCTLKRSGNPDFLSQFGQTVTASSSASSPYLSPVVAVPPEPASLPVFPGGPDDSPPALAHAPAPPSGLSFVVGGSEGCDDGNLNGGGSAGFSSCPSMFATPDLSVYPSPTLSAGSFGPTTPSPYLPGGLFGYPTVFDPGHGSLSSMGGWDTSSFSPCGLMYPDDLHGAGISEQQDALTPVSAEEICCTTQPEGMQPQLPSSTQSGVPVAAVHHPLCARAHSGDCDNGGGGDRDGLPRTVGTQCTVTAVDMSNIDPILLMEGRYSPFALVGQPSRQMATDDAEADMDTGTGGHGGGPYLRILNLAGARNESSSSSSSSNSGRGSRRIFQHHNDHHQQLGLALGTTSTPAMGELASVSGSGQCRLQASSSSSTPTRHLASVSSGSTTTTKAEPTDSDTCSFSRDLPSESHLSLPSPGASSNSAQIPMSMSMSMMSVPRGDNPSMNMIMFKFVPPPTGSESMPGTPIAAAAAALGMGIEPHGGAQEHDEDRNKDEEEELQLQFQEEDDANANANANSFDNTKTPSQTQMLLALAVDHSAGTEMARCQCQYQWDSTDAWLVQSDSVGDVDEEVSVVAMA